MHEAFDEFLLCTICGLRATVDAFHYLPDDILALQVFRQFKVRRELHVEALGTTRLEITPEEERLNMTGWQNKDVHKCTFFG